MKTGDLHSLLGLLRSAASASVVSLPGASARPAAAAPLREFSFRSRCPQLVLLLAGTARFLVWRRWFDDFRYFDLDLPCRGAPLGREVLAAAARRIGAEVERLQLQQWVARRRRDGAAVLLVPDSGLADESGRGVAWSECEGAEWRDIGEEEAVRTAGELRTVVLVVRK